MEAQHWVSNGPGDDDGGGEGNPHGEGSGDGVPEIPPGGPAGKP